MSKKAKSYHKAVLELNSRQRDAFEEPGHAVLLAGPGSGKTATLVLKVARLLNEIPPPHGLACLTYGNEAAREFEQRLRAIGVRPSSRLFTGTVHSFCLAHVLRPFASRLGSGRAYLATGEIASDDELRAAREKGLEGAGVNEQEIWWKAKLEEYRRLALVDPAFAERLDPRLPQVSRGYEEHLRALGRIDFDDIVLGSLELVASDEHVRRALRAKYPWFVIDEYQDLGLALHRMVKELLEKAGVKVFAVGDPDQSIFGFSGARPEFLDELAATPGVRPIRLQMNYRCRQTIIDASLHVLRPEEGRDFQSAVGGDELGEVIFERRDGGLPDQAAYVATRIRESLDKGIPPGEIGVFAKRWSDLAECERALSSAAIPYRVVRGREYRQTPLTTWVEDMATWCAGGWRAGQPRMAELFSGWERLAHGCRSASAEDADLPGRIQLYQMLSSLREPTLPVKSWAAAVDATLGLTGIGRRLEAAPLQMRHDLRELSTMLECLAGGALGRQTLAEFAGIDREKVVLQSLHSSKGLEYTIVFMLALENGVLPRYRENEREARRLFYVGMTRARREVHLLFSGFYHNSNGQLFKQGSSPFLPELWKRLHPKAG